MKATNETNTNITTTIKKSTLSKLNRKCLLVVPMFLGCSLLATGCAGDSGENASQSENSQIGAIEIDWENVNVAIGQYDFEANSYYIDSAYEEEQMDFNSVSVTNYDQMKFGAFKEVEYQLLITYGECYEMNAIGMESKVYEEPMIEISLMDNDGEGDYAVIYKTNGEVVETSGEWFLSEDQEEYLEDLLNDAQEMFGLEE